MDRIELVFDSQLRVGAHALRGRSLEPHLALLSIRTTQGWPRRFRAGRRKREPLLTEDDIRHFLIVYDIPTGDADVRDFGTDYGSAMEAYAEAEEEMHGRRDLDIVLLGADSLETVQRTHSSYFETGETFEALLPEGVLIC